MKQCLILIRSNREIIIMVKFTPFLRSRLKKFEDFSRFIFKVSRLKNAKIDFVFFKSMFKRFLYSKILLTILKELKHTIFIITIKKIK